MTKLANNQHNDVKTITPDWDVPKSVRVYSTTRIGGVSEAPYNALNIGTHVDDDPDRVHENRALVIEAIQAPNTPLWLSQVHGRDVVFVDCYYQHNEAMEADGTFTRDTGKVLCVGTADCLPVVVANSEGTALAVMHAGWRGLADGVLQSGLAHFSETDQLHAWLGPAIGPEAFEVGKEVVDLFLSRSRENAAAFKPGQGGKFMADIYQLARLQLNRLRPMKITGGDHCTYTEADLFHSFRRDGAASGRMGTFAWLE